MRAAGAEHDQENSEVVYDDERESPSPAAKETPAETPEVKKPEEPTKPEPKSAEADPEKIEPPKDETPYQKAVREKRDREAKAWQKIEEEKSQLARDRAELEQARKTPAQPAKPKPFIPDGEDFSAKDYAAAYHENVRKFNEAKAAFDEAEAAKFADLARQAQFHHNRVVQAEQQHRTNQIQRNWDAEIASEIERVPDLKLDETGKPATDLGRRVLAILDEYPELKGRKGGFTRAVKAAQAHLGAESASALQAQVEKLTKENERLTRSTSINPTPPVRRSGSSSSPDRAKSESELLRMAAEHDMSTA